jgi:hypothetical protein
MKFFTVQREERASPNSPLKRVAYALNQNFTPDSESWLEVGDTADERLYLRDLRAVLALAKEASELRRRVRRIRVQARWLMAGNWTYDNARAVMNAIDKWTDLRRPLPKKSR